MASYRCVVVGTLMGQVTNNVFCLQLPGEGPTPNPVGAQQAAQNLFDNWESTLLTRQSAAFTLERVESYGVGDPTVGGLAGSPDNGGSSGEAMPSFVTARLRLRTGFRGRAYNSTIGLPGLTETHVTNNTLTVTARDLFQSSVNALIAGLADDVEPAFLAILSTIVDGAPRPVPLVTPVTGIEVQSLVGTQNGRKQ